MNQEEERVVSGDTYNTMGESPSGPGTIPVRGRGRGRGTGGRQGITRSLMLAGISEMNPGQVSTGPMTRRKRVMAAANTPEGDTEPTSDSQSSVSSSHRYSLRSREGTPLRSTKTNSTDQSDISEEEVARGSASRKKGSQSSVTRKRASSRQPAKSSKKAKLVTVQRLIPRLDPPPALTGIMPATQGNPLFLRMTHWIHANTIPNGVPNLAESQANQIEALATREASLETEVVNDSHSQSDASSSETSQAKEGPKTINIAEKYSLFRFIPSSTGGLSHAKRRRSPSSSQIEPLHKAQCMYPGQSIRNQSGHLMETCLQEQGSESVIQMESLLLLDRQSSLNSSILSPLTRMGLDGSDSGTPAWSPFLNNEDAQSRRLADTEVTDSDTTPRQTQHELPSQAGTDSSMLLDMEDQHPTAHITESKDPADSVTSAVDTIDTEELTVEDGSNDHTLASTVGRGVVKRVTRLGEDGLVGGLIPLMEHIHEELTTDTIREHVAAIGRDVEARWTSSRPPLNEMGAQYVLEGFQNIQVPTLLFSPVTPTPSDQPRWFGGHSSRAANIYLTIATYFHLLGLRAATSIRENQWKMVKTPTSSCTLANFTLQFSNPQSTHNQHARDVFTSHFIRATHAKLYSARCITGALLTESKVSSAFNHALRVQVQLQKLLLTDTAYQAIHREEYRDAIKIGKWLLLNQALRATHDGAVTQLIAKIGPDLCSSDESGTEKDGDEEMESGAGDTERTGTGETGTISWQSQGIAALFTSLQDQGLYPRRHSHLSRRKLSSSKPPPDGTPVSWISEQYLSRVNQR